MSLDDVGEDEDVFSDVNEAVDVYLKKMGELEDYGLQLLSDLSDYIDITLESLEEDLK